MDSEGSPSFFADVAGSYSCFFNCILVACLLIEQAGFPPTPVSSSGKAPVPDICVFVFWRVGSGYMIGDSSVQVDMVVDRLVHVVSPGNKLPRNK